MKKCAPAYCNGSVTCVYIFFPTVRRTIKKVICVCNSEACSFIQGMSPRRTARPRAGKETHMLVLTRKKGEQVVIGTGELTIRVEVVEIAKGRIKLGISAPEDVTIHRQEVWQALNQWQIDTVPLSGSINRDPVDRGQNSR